MRRLRSQNTGAFLGRLSGFLARVGLVVILLALGIGGLIRVDWPRLLERGQTFIEAQTDTRELYDPWALAREAHAGLEEARETSCDMRRATGDEPLEVRQRLETRRLALVATHSRLADIYETELSNNADGRLERPADLPPQAVELCGRIL